MKEKVKILKNLYMAGLLVLLVVSNSCRVYNNPLDPKNSNSYRDDVSSLNTDEIIQPENWELLQDYLNEQASMGVSGPPSADSNAIPVTADLGKWYGGVLAPNGKIYGIPRDYDHVLVIDPVTNTADYATIGVPNDPDKWSGGVLAPNGKIYGVPRDYDYVLIIDPDTGTADFATLGVAAGAVKWVGGVLAPNGKIYCIPRDYDHILIIDPKSNGTFTGNVSLGGYLNKF